MAKIHLSDGSSYEGVLIVVNEYARGNANRRQFRLYWENPGTSCGVPAYGLCSEPFFSREWEAIARGERDFGVKAVRRSW